MKALMRLMLVWWPVTFLVMGLIATAISFLEKAPRSVIIILFVISFVPLIAMFEQKEEGA